MIGVMYGEGFLSKEMMQVENVIDLPVGRSDWVDFAGG